MPQAAAKAGHSGPCQGQAVQEGPCQHRLPASLMEMLRCSRIGLGVEAAQPTGTALQGRLCITLPDTQIPQAHPGQWAECQ